MTTITPQRRKTCTTRSTWTNANLGQPWMVLLVVGLLMPSGRPDSFVAAQPILIPDWVNPYTGAPTKDAVVGDTIEFVWPNDQTHNVYIHPSGTCSDTVGAIRVGPLFGASPENFASYVFTEDDLGGAASKNIFFACDIGLHCSEGNQKLIVTLRPKPTSPPTKQPTRPPTKNPTKEPTKSPTKKPTPIPTRAPTRPPTRPPTYVAGGVAPCSLSLSLTLSFSLSVYIYIYIYISDRSWFPFFCFFSLSLSLLWFDAIVCSTRSIRRPPTRGPTRPPTRQPSKRPSKRPTREPSKRPSKRPTKK